MSTNYNCNELIHKSAEINQCGSNQPLTTNEDLPKVAQISQCGSNEPKSVTNCNTTTEKKKFIPSFDGTKSRRIEKPMVEVNPKHLAFLELRDKSSLNETQIAEVLGYNRTYIPQLKKRLDQTSIVTKTMKRLAKRAVKETLEMKPVMIITEKKNKDGTPASVAVYPTHTNRLTAASMVLERAEPVIQHVESHNLNVQLDMSPVDLSKYRRKD